LAGFLVLGAFFTIIAFRIFQPYAFSGPGFFGVAPNPAWVQTISEQRMQASGDVDFPPALQWARRSATYSFENLVTWGLGLPLGLLAFAGLAWMGWRIVRGEAQQHLLLWFWTLAYFVWQSMEWNPTMRYQLPIYPLLAMMAAWFIFNGPRWTLRPDPAKLETETRTHPAITALYVILGLAVLLSTFAWAHAFTHIYTREHSRVQATRWIYQNVPGPINVRVAENDKVLQQPLPFQRGFILTPATPLVTQFTAKHSGELRELTFAHIRDPHFSGTQVVTFTIARDYTFESDAILATAAVQEDFSAFEYSRSGAYTVRFDTTSRLEAGQNYHLRIETDGELTFSGSKIVSETDWDDGLPLRMDGYDGYGGIYEGGLKFQAYWDDNPDKLQLFYEALDGGDYLFITSNRQWGTTTRVPERYPLTTAFYYALLGCPADADVLVCYATARPGDYQGQLGYELVQVFESYPTLDLGSLGYWEFNNQLADEAFTVYDHPKVLLFKKSESYDPQAARAILGSVDLTQVIRLTPRRAGDFPGGDMTPRVCLDQPGLCHLLGAPEAAQLTGQGLGTASFGMMLSPERLAVQRAGGDWNTLFSYDYLQNRFPVLGLLLWYLFLFVLGVVTYPLLRLLLPGLRDGGYPLARFAGLMMLAWLAWLGASLGGVYTRTTIALAFGLIVALGLLSARYQRETLREEIRARGRYFLIIESLFLAFFLIDLFIRIGNPDLWHPSKGGERPMDFAYFNAVLRSTTFPPYDPWFAGGYLNYYYYGFVLVGTPVKLLALTPSIAYNFILPSLFAMLALGGFSAAWNLFDRARKQQDDEEETAFGFFDGRLMAGFGAAVGLVLVGNLGTIRTIYHALQKLVVGNEMINNPDVWIPQRWGWALQGFFKSFRDGLPVPTGEWYWNPSRVLPPGSGNEITEFPLFTFIYSDLHAHMISLPIMALAVAWAVSTLFARGLTPWRWLATLAFGGLVIGALRPTNTWDFPTYLALGAVVTLYAVFRYAEVDQINRFGLPPIVLRGLLAFAVVGVLAFFAVALYQPYAQWFGLGYSEVNRWEGSRTPIWSYWTHWGLFLYVIIMWMGWETIKWLAQTPLSALNKLKPYVGLIQLALVLFLAVLVLVMFVGGAKIAWFILPLAAWALLLILRPDQPEAKRMALFLVGTALAITLFVELFALSGDIGRMNTIFKLYMQAWIMFAVAAGLALASTLNDLDSWASGWRKVWQIGLLVFFSAAFLFTLTGSFDKMRDRMTAGVPLTLDSMEFMAHATYWDGEPMDLGQDYRAIRWLQANVPASPVIVEGHAPEYRWGSRFSIYTGLPSVIGWNWHQRQQRTLTPDTWVWNRANDVRDFYETADIAQAHDFLEKYDVGYIIVGQMERNYYVPGGLLKFDNYEGRLWREVYRDADTVIYEVIE
jgi:YYY domain-containing protein